MLLYVIIEASLKLDFQVAMLEWLFGKKNEKPEKSEKKQKKVKSASERQTEDKWMYDFLVQFLNSPLWRVSILDFVDANCVVFDNEEENKFEYTKIHRQFKELVTSLFDGMMQEIGLDGDKLAELVAKGFESKQKKLFNQLLLCEDFLKFKELMLRRNKTLEQEALEVLQGQKERRRPSRLEEERELIHSSMLMEKKRQEQLDMEEEEMLAKALELSKREAAEYESIQKLEQKAADTEQGQSNPPQQSQQTPQHESQIAKRGVTKKQQLRKKLDKKKKLDALPSQSSKLSNLPPLKSSHPRQETEENQTPTVSQQFNKESEKTKSKQPAKEEYHKMQPAKEECHKVQPAKEEQHKVQSQEDRKKRLIQQRQKIRKMKQEERKKLLEDQQMNSKVVNIVLQDEGISDSTVAPKEDNCDDKVSKEEIERRRQLMNKIKKRIVDDF